MKSVPGLLGKASNMMCQRHLLFLALLITWNILTSHPMTLAEKAPDSSESIELLDVIEVTGTTVPKAARTLSFPLPTFNHLRPLTTFYPLGIPNLHVADLPQIPDLRLILDQTGAIRGRFTGVKPLKTERPFYPRLAREQGWQGKVVLRANITATGTVKQVAVQESSGFPVLDDSALQAVKDWSFEPAKNGEFVVASTVALPIRFDLLQ